MEQVVLLKEQELSEMITNAVTKALRDYESVKPQLCEYLSTQELAEYLNVNPVTIARACSNKQLKYHKIGKFYFFNKNDLFSNEGQNNVLFKRYKAGS